MAAPSVTSTKETTNYARLCRLLVDVGSQALRDTFDRFHKGNLHTFLGNSAIHSKLKALKGKRILNPTQWSKLYPAVPSTVTSASFDITLVSVLLREICGLSPPASTSSWDKPPPATDTCREADLVRIKHFRNNVYGHAEKASVDDVTFNGLWHDIESVLVRLGGSSYAAATAKLKGECMDPDIEEHYKEALLMWKTDEDNIKNMIEELDKKWEAYMKSSVFFKDKFRHEVNEKLDKFWDVFNEKLDYLTKREIDKDKDKPMSELPEEVCNVHGHRTEVDDVVRALSGEKGETAAGVLVSGIAGVGKSTVAIQAGHRLKKEFEAIVKFCSLRGAYKGESEDDGVLREILNVCFPGYQQSSEYPKHVLLNWCRRLEYDLILIVDNAEDAINDHGNYTFLDLLSDMRKCSNLRIKFLITSRYSGINTAGTVSNIQLNEIPVGPLDVRESMEVLKDGANLPSEADPSIQVKLHKIAELCENIPLVLRLAGPLLAEESEYSFDGLIQELEKDPTKTLDREKMMEIAFEKLDEPLKHALVCLSVFPRSFARDAAETLLGKVNCGRHLTKLKQRCWIQKQGNRYLIHLLIRSYARKIGEGGEFRQFLALGHQRFTEHFLLQILKNSDKYWGKDTCKESFLLFSEERINLESTLRVVGQQKIRNSGELERAVTACQQVAPYIEYCVPFKIYDDFLKGLLHFSQSQGKITKEVEILCLLYHESRKHGEGDKKNSKDLIHQAIKLHEDNRPLFEEDSLSEVFYLNHYGRYLSQDRNEREQALLLLESAISTFEKEATRHCEHYATFDKGRILSQMGHNAKLHKDGIKHEAALKYYSEALSFRRERYGRHLLTAFSLKEMADYYLYIYELGKADENYTKAIAILKDIGVNEQKEIVPICKNFGICYQEKKDFVRSREMFEKGSSVADNTIEGNHKWKVWIKTCLALLLYKEYPEEEDEAHRISVEVFQMGEELGMKKWPKKEELEKHFLRASNH